jgi:hypothetical protein
LLSCANDNGLGNLASEERINENPSSFKEIGSIVIGGKGAAEISAYDEVSKSFYGE